MKAKLISVNLCLCILAGFIACNKADQDEPIAKQLSSNPKTHARGAWSWLLAFFGLGPTITFEYKAGYYESTGPAEWQFKCNPGDATCEFIFHASATGSGGSHHSSNSVWSGSSSSDSVNVQPEGFASASMGFDQNGALSMVILKSSMTLATFEEHYADGLMSIPGPWKLPIRVTSSLGLPDDYTIAAGNYPMQLINNEYLVVKF